MAIVKPRIVTARAVIFRYQGIVIWGTVMVGMVLVIKKPAKILPIRRRLMEFIRYGLFSLIRMSVGNRGWPKSAKKMIRVLYAAVREVATRVIRRAQALVYDVLADSMIRSLE